MLQVREEQMLAFEEAALKRFEEAMIEHVRARFPKRSAVLGRQTILQVIRHGYRQGKQYGFTTQHQACLFIDLAIVLGSGFATDPQVPWAGEILRDPSIVDPTKRIDHLYEVATEYLDQVAGKNEPFPVGPLRKMLDRTTGRTAHAPQGDRQGATAELRRIWPEKYKHVGHKAISVLVQQTTEAAGEYGLSEGEAADFYVLLAFLLGHQFGKDPQYATLGNVLNDKTFGDPSQKLERLHSAVVRTLTEAPGSPSL